MLRQGHRFQNHGTFPVTVQGPSTNLRIWHWQICSKLWTICLAGVMELHKEVANVFKCKSTGGSSPTTLNNTQF